MRCFICKNNKARKCNKFTFTDPHTGKVTSVEYACDRCMKEVDI